MFFNKYKFAHVKNNKFGLYKCDKTMQKRPSPSIYHLFQPLEIRCVKQGVVRW